MEGIMREGFWDADDGLLLNRPAGDLHVSVYENALSCTLTTCARFCMWMTLIQKSK